MGRIGFSSLDVSDIDEPKYQIRDAYELTNSIPSTNEQYNDCFLLHSATETRIRFSNNPIQLIIVSPQTLR